MNARSRIALSSLLMGAAALAAGQGGAGAVTMAGTSTVGASCATHADPVNTARAARGHNRVDGNELTAAQARAFEASFTTAMAAKGYTKTANGSARKGGGGGAFTPTTVNVYFHVITSGTTGDVSGLVDRQLSVLNSAYTGTGFSFAKAGVDKT
ncbi:MAG TPA: zinc metalloprotease, partial [Pedococcus sp.]